MCREREAKQHKITIYLESTQAINQTINNQDYPNNSIISALKTGPRPLKLTNLLLNLNLLSLSLYSRFLAFISKCFSFFYCITLQSRHIHTWEWLKTIVFYNRTLEQQHPQQWLWRQFLKTNFVDADFIMSVLLPFHIFNSTGVPNSSRKCKAWLAVPGPHRVCPVRDTGNGHHANPRRASKLSALPHCCGSMMKEIHLH